MRTVSLKSVLFKALTDLGQEPDAGAPSPVTVKKLVRQVNERLREAWEYAFWPELMLMEQRTFRDAWDVATIYGEGDEVYHEGEYWECLADGTVAQEPDDDSDYWEHPAILERYVEWEQSGQTAIGTVKSVAARNRFRSEYPGYLTFFFDAQGVHVGPLAPAEVWLEFRLRPAVFGGDEWKQANTYAAGDLVWVNAAGESYKSLQAGNTGNNPQTSATWWEKVEFPAELAPFVQLAVYADGLKEDRQGSKAAAEARAYAELARAASVQFEQQSQVQSAEFRGY